MRRHQAVPPGFRTTCRPPCSRHGRDAFARIAAKGVAALPDLAAVLPAFYTPGQNMPPTRTARTPAQPAPARAKDTPSATVGYEAELWRMADALRGSMDAAEYKHVVLGLIFLKYISDAFEEHHARFAAEQARPRRHLPQRPFPRPQSRLHPRQPALQRLRPGRRASARQQTLEIRRAGPAGSYPSFREEGLTWTPPN
jgi:hypothetical protein